MTKSKVRVTIADVAEKADVSTMTVSRVLNNKEGISEQTRENVLNVMRDLGYRPNRIARSLATDKSLKIGVVVPSISSAYFGAVLEGAERVFWEAEYHIVLCNTGNSAHREATVMELFEEDRVDGVLAFSSHLSKEDLSNMLRTQRAAVVINAEVEPGVAGHIYVDEFGAMSLAVRHLLSKSRCCLGYIGMGKNSFAKRERMYGFMASLKKQGQAVDPDHILTLHSEDNKQAIAGWLQDHPQIDGVICFNDNIAATTLRACADLDKCIPDDVAVIGYDDIYLAELVTPTLTTLRLSMTKIELGAMAARMLLERIEGHVDQSPIVLNHELILRDSAP